MEMDLRGFSPAGEVFVFLIVVVVVVVFIWLQSICCFVTRTEVILLRLFAILMSRIYLMKYYMLRIWSRLSCQVFCFFVFFFFCGGVVIARDFILLSSTNLLPKCFQMLVKFLLFFHLAPIYCCLVTGTEAILLRHSAIPMSRLYLMKHYLLRIWLRFCCHGFFLVTARDLILVSSMNLLPKCLQMPVKFCCCCCFIWLQSIIVVVVVWLEL
jgi:hypothetical protein